MDIQEPTFEESVKQVMQTLPPIIRAYLAEGKYTPVAQNLMRTYALRVDQGGVLEREVMLLLMGIETPDEFVRALTQEAKLPEDTVNKIVQDVNSQIFIPLREAERKSQIPEKHPASIEPGSHFHLQNKIAPQPRPVAAAGPRPANLGLQSALKKALSGGKPFDPAYMLEDHEEPHIDISTKNQAPSTKPQNIPPSMPVTAPNLPGAMPPQPVPPPARPTAPPQAPQKPASYTVDPYREPIDDHEQ